MIRALGAAALLTLAACGDPGPPGEMTLPHCSGGIYDFAHPARQDGPPNTPHDVLVERIEATQGYPDDPSVYHEWREDDGSVVYHHDSDHVQIRISIRDISDGRDVWAVDEEGICRDEPPPDRPGPMTATAPTGEPLVGRVIRLDRTTLDDVEGLHRVFSNPDNFTDGYAMSRPSTSLAETEATVRDRMARSEGHVAYTARLLSDGTVVGTSSIGDVDVAHERAHIGWTMWDRPVWGTAVNPEAKLLMLAHCFEDCGLGRVKIQTDVQNLHSQAAIAKLGAQREGVLRRHVRRADGTWRDTVVFSILVDEWPAVRAGLEARLAKT